MIKKDNVKTKKGLKTHIRVVEGYRDENGKSKMRTIKTFGYLEDQSDQTAFMNSVIEFDKQFFKEKKEKLNSYTTPFYLDDSSIQYNYGYKFIEAIYNSLDIDSFFLSLELNVTFPVHTIFKYLVIERLLNPDSKKATFEIKDSLYHFDTPFELHHVYRALDVFNKYKVELQKYINDKIKSLIGRNTSYAYYDVTNYFTTIDYPKDENDLRQRGVSKENSHDPIIQLGLFIDDKGIPVSMSLLKGNTADCKTLQPIMKEIKSNYGLNRLIVVADKGLNSTDNINYIMNNHDGYVVSQILRGKKGQRYHEKILDDSLYTYNHDRTFKYQEFIEEYEIINQDKKKETKKRKVLIYWKLEDEIQAVRKRDEKLDKALKSLGNNVYGIKHAYEEYIKETHFVEETGEIATKVQKEIDQKKVQEDSKFDGYFCIITSELEYDYKKIMEVYSGLWRIEESFRITKSEIETRPIYVNLESRINGHFLTCYVALILVRLLQYKINYSLSAERIIRALKSCNCIIEDKFNIKLLRNIGTMPLKNETIEIADAEIIDLMKIVKAYGCSTPFARYKKNDFEQFLQNIHY